MCFDRTTGERDGASEDLPACCGAATCWGWKHTATTQRCNCQSGLRPPPCTSKNNHTIVRTITLVRRSAMTLHFNHRPRAHTALVWLATVPAIPIAMLRLLDVHVRRVELTPPLLVRLAKVCATATTGPIHTAVTGSSSACRVHRLREYHRFHIASRGTEVATSLGA